MNAATGALPAVSSFLLYVNILRGRHHRHPREL
jgi:hypothetical protein